MSARSLMVMCALAALAHCAKSEIVSAQEEFNKGVGHHLKGIVVNDPTAVIGSAEKHVKTPWMIVSPDGKRGFANEFTTNAISVVTGDGVNYYAHQQDENGDRTRVIHFTVDENGIPSRTGELIDTTNSGEANNVEKMKKRKLIGVNKGTLYFYPYEEYGTPLIYNPEDREKIDEPDFDQKKFLATYNNGYRLYILVKRKSTNNNRSVNTEVLQTNSGRAPSSYSDYSNDTFPEDPKNMTVSWGWVYTGDSAGNIFREGTFAAKLPGAVSSLSENDNDEAFATTKATNAFYNVTLGQYNVVKDENGNPKPMVPQTQDGLIKVIDNRKNGGKFLYVTSKGIYSIDD